MLYWLFVTQLLFFVQIKSMKNTSKETPINKGSLAYILNSDGCKKRKRLAADFNPAQHPERFTFIARHNHQIELGSLGNDPCWLFFYEGKFSIYEDVITAKKKYHIICEECGDARSGAREYDVTKRFAQHCFTSHEQNQKKLQEFVLSQELLRNQNKLLCINCDFFLNNNQLIKDIAKTGSIGEGRRFKPTDDFVAHVIVCHARPIK